MKETDIKFLYGKGHICNYCDCQKSLCRSINYIKDYAQKERQINEMNIQIFACSLFRRKEEDNG